MIHQKFQIGMIASTHGIAGEVNVYPTTPDPVRFKKLKTVTMEDARGNETLLTIEHVKLGQKFVILKFKGYDSINDVERWKGRELTVPREHASKLAPGEVYSADLIGCEVFDVDNGEKLGVITEVIATAANDVYEMEPVTGGEHVMIPAIKSCIRSLEPENNKVVIYKMPGLMD